MEQTKEDRELDEIGLCDDAPGDEEGEDEVGDTSTSSKTNSNMEVLELRTPIWRRE